MKNSIFKWKKKKTNIKVLLFGDSSTPNKKQVAVKKTMEYMR